MKLYAFFYMAVFSILVLIDQVTKYMSVYLLRLYQVTRLDLIGTFFAIEVEFNRGVSWGLLHSNSTGLFVAVTASVMLITLVIAVYTYKQFKEGASIIAELLIMSGSLSNIIDRVWHGGVLDWISISFFGWDFPIFNVADSYILLGVLYYMLSVFCVDSGKIFK